MYVQAQEDCTDDSDSQMTLSRLVQLRKSREKTMNLLSSALESKETLANNLNNCIDCKNNLESKLRIDSRSSTTTRSSQENMASLAEKELKMNEQRMKAFLANENDSTYGGLDRKWYSEKCHIVCFNGAELLRRLDACTDLIFLSNEKLQNLVEVRENMNNLQLQGKYMIHHSMIPDMSCHDTRETKKKK